MTMQSFCVIVAINLKCDYIDSEWYITGTIKNCYARLLDIRTPQPLIESINHDNTSTFRDVKGFWIENEVSFYVPHRIADFFPDLTAFGIQNSGLKEITKFDLEPLRHIIRLALYSNKLQYLETDLFFYNKELKSITLFDNNLMVVGENIFNSLPQLSLAELKIRCIDKKCDSRRGCFQDMSRDLKNFCQSDLVIEEFKTKIQILENDLKRAKKENCENYNENIEQLVDIRFDS